MVVFAISDWLSQEVICNQCTNALSVTAHSDLLRFAALSCPCISVVFTSVSPTNDDWLRYSNSPANCQELQFNNIHPILVLSTTSYHYGGETGRIGLRQTKGHSSMNNRQSNLHINGDEHSLSCGLYGYKLVKVFETCFANCIQARHTATKADLMSFHLPHPNCMAQNCVAQTFLAD